MRREMAIILNARGIRLSTTPSRTPSRPRRDWELAERAAAGAGIEVEYRTVGISIWRKAPKEQLSPMEAGRSAASKQTPTSRGVLPSLHAMDGQKLWTRSAIEAVNNSRIKGNFLHSQNHSHFVSTEAV